MVKVIYPDGTSEQMTWKELGDMLSETDSIIEWDVFPVKGRLLYSTKPPAQWCKFEAVKSESADFSMNAILGLVDTRLDGRVILVHPKHSHREIIDEGDIETIEQLLYNGWTIEEKE